jgi:hypothetical protein
MKVPAVPLHQTTAYTYRHTDRWEEFMKYAAEMSIGAIIYIPCFINICSGIQKLMQGGYRDIHHGDHISLLLFFQNKKSRLNWDGFVTVLSEFFELHLSIYTAYS